MLIARNFIAVPKSTVAMVERFSLMFEDGITIETTQRRTNYSDYFWDIHRCYPNTPMLVRHHVDHVLKGKPLTSSAHIDLLNIIYKDVVECYQLRLPEQREHLLSLIYEITNNVNNEMTRLAEPNVTTIDILDFIEVVEHPIISEVTANTISSDASIANCYEVVSEVLYKDYSLNENALAIAVRSKMVNINQVLQCVSVRGKLTEVDGQFLPLAILSNFTKGLNDLYELAGESRSAAKSLYFSDSKLQDSEYTARRIQLLAMIVESIDYVDCGSTKYLDWRITPPSYDAKGNVMYPGDLVFMLGKYYLDDISGELRQITHNDPELYGQVLHLRSVLHCIHPNPHQICEVCFGGLAKNVSRFSNIGHLCATTMTQQITQSVLSIKHLDYSGSSSRIVLNEVSSRFFNTDRNKNSYILKSNTGFTNIRLVVSRDEAVGLMDILNIDDVKNVNPTRISEIECIDIVYDRNGVEESMFIYLAQSNKKVMLSTEFLSYLKIHRWETDQKNNFVFNLVDWNFSLPVFKLPEMEYSFSDHSVLISEIIESNIKNISERQKPHSAISTLQELFSLVNTKINVNIAALEVIVYSTMIQGVDMYSLGRNSDTATLGVAASVIKNRSLGAAYAYEDIYRTIINPRSFFKLDRPDSLFDACIDPHGYVSSRS